MSHNLDNKTITAFKCPANVIDNTLCYDLGSKNDNTTFRKLIDERITESCKDFKKDIEMKKIPVAIKPEGSPSEKPNYPLIIVVGNITNPENLFIVLNFLSSIRHCRYYRSYFLHCMVREKEGEREKHEEDKILQKSKE